jgi:hypothetical protein
MKQPAINPLFTDQECNEYYTKESRLVFNAKNYGKTQPLIKFWNDKRAVLIQRADERGLVARAM